MTALDLCSFGTPTGRGNLLGVQPRLVAADYRSAAALERRLAAYLALAEGQGWLHKTTVAVFPEYIGTWLVAAGAPSIVYRAPTLEAAFGALVRQHLLRFVVARLRVRAADGITAALFHARAPQMARDYNRVFGGLAARFGITVVAGSIVLPAPAVVAGEVRPGRGALRNVAAVYRPDGAAHEHLVTKSFLTNEEQPFTTALPPHTSNVFSTPTGRLGVIICADSWFPAAYAPLSAAGAELIAVPAFVSGNDSWGAPWGGYNGTAPPDDIVLGDVGRISEGEAWRRYAMAGRMGAAGIRWGITAFLRGDLWGMGSAGATIAARAGCLLGSPTHTAAVVNLWLNDKEVR